MELESRQSVSCQLGIIWDIQRFTVDFNGIYWLTWLEALFPTKPTHIFFYSTIKWKRTELNLWLSARVKILFTPSTCPSAFHLNHGWNIIVFIRGEIRFIYESQYISTLCRLYMCVAQNEKQAKAFSKIFLLIFHLIEREFFRKLPSATLSIFDHSHWLCHANISPRPMFAFHSRSRNLQVCDGFKIPP